MRFSRSSVIAVVAAIAATVLGWTAPAGAGARIDVGDGRDLELFFMIQFWDVASFGGETAAGRTIDSRNDVYIRRGRVGVRGRFRPEISYTLNFAFDGVGRDPLGSATGSPQSPLDREFYLWDAFVTCDLAAPWTYLTVGYFRPQVGRESITTAFAVPSFAKALPNSYLREHLVGRTSGRESGVNLGGRYGAEGWALQYDLGLFDTSDAKITGSEAGGVNWAPLWVGRLALTVGDPERASYGLGYRTNYFGTRRGVTLAIDGSYQGTTNPTVIDSQYVGGFRRNATPGWDLLANYDGLNLSAEYDVVYRDFCPCFAARHDAISGREYTDRVWSVRAGYNLALGRGQVLEPVAMVTGFVGDEASAVYPDGEHRYVTAGVNWYLDENRLKVNLHYTWVSGEPVSRYSRTGADEAGDFLGLGWQLVF